MHRVQKLLCNAGHCSRRKAEELISQGKVHGNGKVIHLGDSAEETDTITIDGKPLRRERKVYLMFHKPIRCVTALEDREYKTIMEYIKVKERVFPVGRLDYMTAGLLLLTNDGDFANEIMHPSHEINKSYVVETFRPIKIETLHQLQRGVLLDDGRTKPAHVGLLTPTILEMSIHEGKNRIVRRMMEALGHRVRSLTRVRVGKLLLGNLRAGKFKYLTEVEKRLIFS